MDGFIWQMIIKNCHFATFYSLQNYAFLTGCEEVFQEMNKLGMNQKFSTPSYRYVYTQDNTKINRYIIFNGVKIYILHRPALPEGYTIDSIHSSDIEYVVSKWGPAKDNPKMKQMMRHFIANYPNVAIYDTSTEPRRLVSWIVSSGLGINFHIFTDEEHRVKGLAFIVGTEMIQKCWPEGSLQ